MANEQNGTGICNWEDWRGLTGDQQQFEMWRNLYMLNKRTSDIAKTVKIYAFCGGMVGGAIAICAVVGIKFTVGV